jgi:hypothetical protein
MSSVKRARRRPWAARDRERPRRIICAGGRVKTGLGCVALLVALAVVTYFVDRETQAHLPSDLRFWVAVPAGVLATLGLSNIWMLLRGYGQGDKSRTAVLERARTGLPPDRDGPIVVTGIVRAADGRLRAPISGTACVAYLYRLYSVQLGRGRRRDEVPVYWGYAFRPFHIDSPSHAYRVIAFPQMADDSDEHESAESRERAKAYVAATRFEPMQAMMGMASSVAAIFKEIVTEPSGETRRDWRAESATVDLDKVHIDENVVPIGATVSVSGRWSVERGAIVPGTIGEGQIGVTLVKGPAENLGQGGASELPSSPLSVAVTAVVMLSIAGAIVWFTTTGRVAEWWRTF